MTTLTVSAAKPASTDVDAVVVGIHSGTSGPRPASGAESIDEALGGRLGETLTALAAKGKAEEVTKITTLGALPAPLLVAVGLGDPSPSGDYDLETLRRAAGAAVRELFGTARVAVALPARIAEEAEAVTLGALLGNYAFLRYRTSNEAKPPIRQITVCTGASGAQSAAARAEVLAEVVSLVRDLVNTPPCDLPPAAFAALVEERASALDLDVEVLDEKALREGGYGGILGVGQGSVNPPRLVRVAYTPAAATTTLALVGKGITFDSGGLSLKPTASMDTMKSDMGGAAAVFGALLGIAKLELAINVIGYLPLAENMPSGTAQRPSDVLTTYSGKTVEVMNTDAEGRLVLADALGRAIEDSPDLLVDVATLTGAQLVALGPRTSGVMANSDEVRDQVVDAARRAGESMWPMPLPDELRKGLNSQVADIANVTGERSGGMLTAGLFLKEFLSDGVRWAHLDIAGPAFNKGEPYGYTPKGGTGAATRTLIRIAADLAAASPTGQDR